MSGRLHALRAVVIRKLERRGELSIIEVELGGERKKAVHFPLFFGRISEGEEVIVNTTAVDLGLGTGGYHFVMGKLGSRNGIWSGTCKGEMCSGKEEGHIMKLRYTPLQFAIRSVEEKTGPYHDLFTKAEDLGGLPVIIGELHSMLVPAVILLYQLAPGSRIVYIMPDAGALPLQFSNLLPKLASRYSLAGTITTGHAFGGDLEAVNLYSALIAARRVLGAEYVIVTMGPGIVGTGTKYGFSGLGQADWLNTAERLNCTPILIPRISGADSRARHRGLSHHTRTVLEYTYARANLALDHRWFAAREKPWELDSFRRHRIWFLNWYGELDDLLCNGKDLLHSMGRSFFDDPLFFRSAGLAALLAIRLKQSG